MKEPVLFKELNSMLDSGKLESKTIRIASKSGGTASEFTEWTGKDLGPSQPGIPHLCSVEVVAAPDSVLNYIFIQNLPTETDGAPVEAFARIRISAERGSRVNFTLVQNGASKAQIEVITHCQGEGSEIETRTLQNTHGTQKLSSHIHAIHDVPHTKSDLKVWCVARDQAHSVFNGLISIKPGAHHTEAYQRNKNLILSQKAVVDSFPKLFIANDEVKCAHGSSTSTLEPEQALYLRSRGLNLEQSEAMITDGFVRQALEWIADESSKEKLYTALGVKEEEIWQ